MNSNKLTAIFFSALNIFLVKKDYEFEGQLLNVALDTEASVLFESEYGYEFQSSDIVSSTDGQCEVEALMIEYILNVQGCKGKQYIACLNYPVSLHRFTGSVLEQKAISSQKLDIRLLSAQDNMSLIGLDATEINQVLVLDVGDGLIDFGEHSHTIIRVQ